MDNYLLRLLLFGLIFAVGEGITCLAARNQCVPRLGCGMALHNIEQSCKGLRLGETDICTETCKRAIISFVTVDDDLGTDYLTCDCEGAEDCESTKRRMSMCSDGVLEALRSLDTEKVISCSLARMLCEADTRCWTALSYYEENCSNLFLKHTNSLVCDSKCKNSVDILFNQPRAAKLKSCLCDNTDPIIDESMCIRMRYNTATYCLGQEPKDPFFATSIKEPTKYENYSKDVPENTAALSSSTTSHLRSSLTLYISIAAVAVLATILNCT